MKENMIFKWASELLESISDPALCIDKNGHIIYMNTLVEDFLCLKSRNNKSLTIYDLLASDFVEEFKSILNDSLTGQTKKEKYFLILKVIKKNMTGNFSQIRSYNNKIITCLILNIKEYETSIEKYMMKKILLISKRLINSDTNSIDYQMIADEMRKLSKVKCVAFNIFDSKENNFRIAAL